MDPTSPSTLTLNSNRREGRIAAGESQTGWLGISVVRWWCGEQLGMGGEEHGGEAARVRRAGAMDPTTPSTLTLNCDSWRRWWCGDAAAPIGRSVVPGGGVVQVQ